MGLKKLRKTRLRSLLFPRNGKWGWKRQGVEVIFGKNKGKYWVMIRGTILDWGILDFLLGWTQNTQIFEDYNGIRMAGRIPRTREMAII